MREFLVEVDHQAHIGTPYPAIDTVEKCGFLCKNTPECIGFDYDRNDPPYKNAHCWLHDNPSIELEPQESVDHYRLWEFTFLMNHNANGASPYQGITSVSECAKTCMRTPNCTAFDYDRNDPPYKNAHCWIHNGTNFEVKVQHAVDHYTMGSCTSRIEGKYCVIYDTRNILRMITAQSPVLYNNSRRLTIYTFIIDCACNAYVYVLTNC